MSGRQAEVPAPRFAGWVQRFAAGHGGDLRLVRDAEPAEPTEPADAPRLVLVAADGATAALEPPFAADSPPPGDLPALLAHVAGLAATHPYALLLLRRGGWAVGRCVGERVEAGRVGTRYVQGRTKKGGSSQQRYARRRANQADSVVGAAVAAAPEVWGVGPTGDPRPLATGGDRLLVGDAVGQLSRRLPLVVVRHLDVPDPRRAVLDAAAVSACAVRVRVQDPPGG